MSSLKRTYIAYLFMVILLLFGCSSDISLEEKIVKILEGSENKDFERVIDYDIKDDFIVVIYKSKEFDQLNIGFMKVNNGKLEWDSGMGGPELSGGDQFISDPIVVNVMIPKEPGIKDVKVFEKYAKQVKYSEEINYWIAYTDKSPNSYEVEYIK
ncbi:hypothetical protein D1B31_15195 [Neobacillus notoginsengisoli]|uniref:Uncharacterized protein n=1 Tax=Neobacillus notoginsengisoli TaxID=1578198 RepID=A0A417YS54_9BACI|nr:hypothetical protein [Neobacillus notoginsengisoli]RHW38120.1 hypothetical protein D1B31_15195 [Neobacillus notoginsengisoli]